MGEFLGLFDKEGMLGVEKGEKEEEKMEIGESLFGEFSVGESEFVISILEEERKEGVVCSSKFVRGVIVGEISINGDIGNVNLFLFLFDEKFRRNGWNEKEVSEEDIKVWNGWKLFFFKKDWDLEKMFMGCKF